jgi:anaerobic magnesium-protoporphyrin IX monomethyl ester cyclase
MTISTTLISFLKNSLNIRSLSSYLIQNKFPTTCVFCPEDLNEINLRAILAQIKANGSQLIGISLVTDDYFKAVTITKSIKKNLDVKIIWGGAHVNVAPEECLRHADMICKGEGEEALLDLVREFSNNKELSTSIPNISYKTKDSIIHNGLRSLEENLDKYPAPDFELKSQFVVTKDGLRYLHEGDLNGEYSIITSRGCPYRCRYCYNSYRWNQYKGKGKYLRARSIGNVLEELSSVKKKYPGIRYFYSKENRRNRKFQNKLFGKDQSSLLRAHRTNGI